MSAINCEVPWRNAGTYRPRPGRSATVSTARFDLTSSRGDLRLARLRGLRQGWDGEGAPAPSSLAISISERLLAAIERSQLRSLVDPDPLVEPSVEGGVAISMKRGDRAAYFEICNDGEGFLVLMQRNRDSRIEPVVCEDGKFARALEAARDHLS